MHSEAPLLSKVLLCLAPTLQNVNVVAQTWILISISTVVTPVNKSPFIAIPHDITIGWLLRVKNDFTVPQGVSRRPDVGYNTITVTDEYPLAGLSFWPISHGYSPDMSLHSTSVTPPLSKAL